MITRNLARAAPLLGALLGAHSHAAAQAIQGPTEPTTCAQTFTPASILTWHGGYVWNVTYHTFPFQIGFARYSGLPDPVVSEDGAATWTKPGADVECTNTWYFNPNGSVAYVRYNLHFVRYHGTITTRSTDCGEEGSIRDPVYITSYDPYAPHGEEDAVVLQGCGGSGGQSGSGGSGCHWEWMEVEISYDGGQTWDLYWSGWGQVCESQAT